MEDSSGSGCLITPFRGPGHCLLLPQASTIQLAAVCPSFHLLLPLLWLSSYFRQLVLNVQQHKGSADHTHNYNFILNWNSYFESFYKNPSLIIPFHHFLLFLGCCFFLSSCTCLPICIFPPSFCFLICGVAVQPWMIYLDNPTIPSGEYI